MEQPTENGVELPLDRNLTILYGSQTGCAQDVAERIGREARRRHFRAKVIAMNDYDKARLIHEKLAVFVCSTTGQGDEPDNMKKFWKFLLRKNLPPDLLSQMDYAVFGLGDSSYTKFNYPAKKLHKRLSQFGARSIVPRGDADDQHYLGVDGTLDPWLENLWTTIMDHYPLPPGLSIISADTLFPPSFRLRFLCNGDERPPMESGGCEDGFTVQVVRNERMTADDHFQDVRHIELEVVEGEVSYNPGDVAILQPHNLPSDVSDFLQTIGWSDLADDPFVIDPNQQGDFLNRTLPAHWPRVLTLRRLFEDHLDVFSVPRRSFFEILAFFTQDQRQTEKLREFASAAGQDDMYAYCQRVRRTLAEVLFDFSSAKVPLDYVLDLIPELRARQFSIASAAQSHPSQIHLCVAIIKYKTKIRKIRRGVCTKWMATLKPGDEIHHVKITRGTMRAPGSPTTPLIMIGPGVHINIYSPFTLSKEKRNHSSRLIPITCDT
ncbi:NADPH-dependent diflavin oxidoreductase 1-like protein [Endogone sp. FLAS-F59071]|nr:NADPH-dependent diflavin oxidoreductase 1-like protein [Endogone sp. FLAS-F59071]|eukprot:RUS21655.1 NADPH-dependent diflavin oxidoreductase 1-like protein [Endogone sp. FLAS-F59071]